MKRMQILGCVLATAAVAGCGGSSSETPFPQAPIERELDKRHEAVFASERAEASAPPRDGVSPTLSVEARADGAATSSPVPGSTPSPTDERVPNTSTEAE